MKGALGKQFAREFSDIIVAGLKGEISSVAVIRNGDHPLIVVITNSDDETVPQRITKMIIDTARDLGHYFGKRHQIIPSILSLSDIQSYSDFWLQSPNDKSSFIALIEIHTHKGGISTLHALCDQSELDVLHDDGSFERLLQIARGYH